MTKARLLGSDTSFLDMADTHGRLLGKCAASVAFTGRWMRVPSETAGVRLEALDVRAVFRLVVGPRVDPRQLSLCRAKIGGVVAFGEAAQDVAE